MDLSSDRALNDEEYIIYSWCNCCCVIFSERTVRVRDDIVNLFSCDSFLGAFANLRKASSCLYVPLSVRMELGSHWTNFHEIPLCSFMTVSRSILLRIRNISTKVVEKIERHVLYSITPPPKIVPFMG